MKTLLYLIITLFLSCKPANPRIPGQIPFRLVNNIPVVEGSVNGKKASFIIDSGASISVLDLNQEKRLKFTSYYQDAQAVGYGGVASFRGVQGVSILLSDSISVSADFRAQDLSALVSAIKTHEGVNIAGILGSDVWNKLGAVIDYKSQMLIVTKW